MKSGTKVLVVDDEKRICHNVKKILSKNNFDSTSGPVHGHNHEVIIDWLWKRKNSHC